MEKLFSPPAWCDSQSSEIICSRPARVRTTAGETTSNIAPRSLALRQLRRRTSRLRPCSEKLSRATVADSPVFCRAKPISTISGSILGDMK